MAEGISKKNVLLRVLSAIPFFAVVTLFFLTSNQPRDYTELLIDAKALHFNGKIDSIYRNTSDHGVMTVVLPDKYEYQIWPEWENYFEIGDSLTKTKNSLDVVIIKSDQKRIVLNYRTLTDGRVSFQLCKP